FMVEYAGVANFEVEGGSGKNAGTETKDVLVMCNLKCGFECLRMLDREAVAPRPLARGRAGSGRRSRTSWTASRIPWRRDSGSKARRFMFQRMPATEVFMHLADVHQVPGYPDAAQDAVWTPQEVAEVVLHEA
ncbi:unnamed protein product, partial [Prorocentrum cordatum]